MKCFFKKKEHQTLGQKTCVLVWTYYYKGVEGSPSLPELKWFSGSSSISSLASVLQSIN